MDKAKENIEILLQSLDNLDFRELSGSIRTAFKENPNDDRLATFALKIQQFSENKHSKKIEVLLKNSKVRDVVLFDRLLKYPERQLDMELSGGEDDEE